MTEPTNEELRAWLADQLEAWPDRRVHPDRTMSIGTLHKLAAEALRNHSTDLAARDAEIAALKAKVGELAHDVRLYGLHLASCPVEKAYAEELPHTPCTCGLREARARATLLRKDDA